MGYIGGQFEDAGMVEIIHRPLCGHFRPAGLVAWMEASKRRAWMRRRAVLLGAAGAAMAGGLVRSAWAQADDTQAGAAPPVLREIEAENALEHDFLAAFANPEMRATFRLRLLQSLVTLALETQTPDSPPRLIPLGEDDEAGLIYTSPSRLASVLGPETARMVLTGRQALTRLRGKHVALNYGLLPMLTLEPSDIENFLQVGAN